MIRMIANFGNVKNDTSYFFASYMHMQSASIITDEPSQVACLEILSKLFNTQQLAGKK